MTGYQVARLRPPEPLKRTIVRRTYAIPFDYTIKKRSECQKVAGNTANNPVKSFPTTACNDFVRGEQRRCRNRRGFRPTKMRTSRDCFGHAKRVTLAMTHSWTFSTPPKGPVEKPVLFNRSSLLWAADAPVCPTTGGHTRACAAHRHKAKPFAGAVKPGGLTAQ